MNVKYKKMYELLQKGIPWKWGPSEDFALEQSKRLLMSTNVLVHYNAKLKFIMTVDASSLGVSAVLSHIMTDRSEKPIYFASKTLRAEQNYAQIEREELAVIFGVFKFYKYIYGRKFTIITDHKPLLGIFFKRIVQYY